MTASSSVTERHAVVAIREAEAFISFLQNKMDNQQKEVQLKRYCDQKNMWRFFTGGGPKLDDKELCHLCHRITWVKINATKGGIMGGYAHVYSYFLKRRLGEERKDLVGIYVDKALGMRREYTNKDKLIYNVVPGIGRI